MQLLESLRRIRAEGCTLCDGNSRLCARPAPSVQLDRAMASCSSPLRGRAGSALCRRSPHLATQGGSLRCRVKGGQGRGQETVISPCGRFDRGPNSPPTGSAHLPRSPGSSARTNVDPVLGPGPRLGAPSLSSAAKARMRAKFARRVSSLPLVRALTSSEASRRRGLGAKGAWGSSVRGCGAPDFPRLLRMRLTSAAKSPSPRS